MFKEYKALQQDFLIKGRGIILPSIMNPRAIFFIKCGLIFLVLLFVFSQQNKKKEDSEEIYQSYDYVERIGNVVGTVPIKATSCELDQQINTSFGMVSNYSLATGYPHLSRDEDKLCRDWGMATDQGELCLLLRINLDNSNGIDFSKSKITLKSSKLKTDFYALQGKTIYYNLNKFLTQMVRKNNAQFKLDHLYDKMTVEIEGPKARLEKSFLFLHNLSPHYKKAKECYLEKKCPRYFKVFPWAHVLYSESIVSCINNNVQVDRYYMVHDLQKNKKKGLSDESLPRNIKQIPQVSFTAADYNSDGVFDILKEPSWTIQNGKVISEQDGLEDFFHFEVLYTGRYLSKIVTSYDQGFINFLTQDTANYFLINFSEYQKIFSEYVTDEFYVNITSQH